MNMYYLAPDDSHVSFYKKARVFVFNDGTETLVSYNTPVMSKAPDGTLTRLWGGWSATTGRHIKAFCGIRKAEWMKMEVCRRH